ncbi:E3 ubiquitin-protein ligase RNF14-like [Saccostrea cucullata]|uniref:E3 ubiquitin-protein ligase RNF14-like n=1 Tax=Saccostrea cuccullata TaxID=36930 RepID=UPI002ED35EDD
MTDNKEQQEDELLALTSIFDETVISLVQDDSECGGQFSASLRLPENFQLAVIIDKANDEIKDEEFHRVQHLPPLILDFQLSPDYPSDGPPQFSLSCKWLNRKQLSSLCSKLDELWQENKGSVVLFTWTSFLLDDSFSFLGLENPLIISSDTSRRDSRLDARAIQDIASYDRLLPVILEYNKQALQLEFDKSFFSCQVCFGEKLGSQCIKFMDCGHVFCKTCMREYFTVQISDGNVKGLNCPYDKCESQAHPTQVQELVSKQVFAKYDELLLMTSLDQMVDVMYCPRPSCQYPVSVDKESNFGNCPSCGYVFCVLCQLVYHGLSPCKVKSDGLRKLRDEYTNADEETKKLLEKRYGKKTIEAAIAESLTKEWLDEFSKNCPSCGANIQKIDGCNKMTCMKCRAYFCWLCEQALPKTNPYRHYNTADSPCRNKLFEGMDEFGEDDDFMWM